MYQGKVDLHLHLDGSMSVELVSQLTREEGLSLTASQLEQQLRVEPDCTSLVEYLKKFELPKQLLQTEQNLERAAYDLICRLARQGLVYAEVRFAPQLHTRRGLTMRQVVASVVRGMEQAQRDCPSIRAGLLLCALIGGEENEATFALAKDLIGQGVAGVDLAGAEGMVPLEHFEPLFEDMRRHQIPFTIHAGECGSVENVRRSVDLGARRVGHGCAAAKSEDCMNLLRRSGTVVESCVVSNLQTKAVRSLDQHPIRTFFEQGIAVTVNTDNMTCSNTTLSREHQVIASCFPFTDSEFRQMDAYALGGAFVSEAERKELLAKL